MNPRLQPNNKLQRQCTRVAVYCRVSKDLHAQLASLMQQKTFTLDTKQVGDWIFAQRKLEA